MDKNSLQLLYAYNCWANRQILFTAQRLTTDTPQQLTAVDSVTLLETLCHIANTETAWRSICRTGQYPDTLLEPEKVSLDTLRERWQIEMEAMQQYVLSLSDDDLHRAISFRAGSALRKRVLWQGFFHMINHGTQHRSEVAMLLSERGYSPGNLDFTSFLAGPADYTPL